MICETCKNEFEDRSNKKYCSEACKQKNYRLRTNNKSKSSDFTLKGIEVPKVSSDVIHLQNKAINQISKSVVGSMGGGIGSTLSDGIQTLTRTDNNPYFTLAMFGGACFGGYIGYNMSEKPQKFLNVVIGSGIGLLLGQLGYTLYIQFKQLSIEQQEQLPLKDDFETLQGNFSYNGVISSQEMMFMQIPSLKLSGEIGNFLGGEVNYNFVMLVYGSPGGGKSHFATVLSKYFETIGKVLYVLAEESVTSHVQQRIMRYGTQNTSYLSTRNEDEIIYHLTSGDYKFVVIDSLNGLTNYAKHLMFIKNLETLNLYGIIILNQVNKQGQTTGKNDVLHEVDIEIVINEGIAKTLKTRFPITENNTYSIFKDNHESKQIINNHVGVCN